MECSPSEAALQWEPIINLGLPCTGTLSFATATMQLGMHTMHVCNRHSRHPLLEVGPCFLKGSGGYCHWAGQNPFGEGQAKDDGNVTAYHSLSDTPFFMMDSQQLQRAYPKARLVCTTRTRDSWIRSYSSFKNAGDDAFKWYIFKTTFRASHNTSHSSSTGRALTPSTYRSPQKLALLFELHHNTTCANLPLIHLGDSDAEKWATLCAAVPARWKAACDRWHRAGSPWPRNNSHQQQQNTAL
jgi:hypothetical protein